MDAFEIDVPDIGRRDLLLNARKVFYEDGLHTTILLGLEDITSQRAKERELAALLHHKDVLLREMQHRFGNSLQIIASILLIKARAAQSDETRAHLEDAYQRVISVAAVQQQLEVTEPCAMISLGPYLSRLCEALSSSMIGGGRHTSMQVRVDDGTATASQAVSLGLIVTELLINAVKYAFPDDRKDGTVTVSYEVA
ncbi:sensor histidine kinase, partial [Rhodoplanes sp. SY1]|uniref:sensor histidine kinase n=1 Tax=Rhodoplanes sp. SY1 TaxID=3166646 RepID=UPI0038B4E036